MKKSVPLVLMLIGLFELASGTGHADAKPTAKEVLARLLEADPWGLGGAIASAHAELQD